MRNNRDERYSGFSGWLRKNRTALRSCGIAAAVIGTGLAVWYGVGMYQQRKDQEAMIAARYETQQENPEETLAEMAKEDQESADSGTQTGKEMLFEENTVFWNGKTYKRNQESADSGTQTGKEMLFEENTVFWNGKTYKRNTYVKAVLCMGVDRDGPMTETTLSGDGGQADGIFLLANDTARGSMKILLIPRDSMTEITKTDTSWTETNGAKLGEVVDHLSLSYAYGDGGSMKILLIPRDSMTEITKTDTSWTETNGAKLGEVVDHLSLSYAYGDGREKSCEYTKQAVSHLLMGLKIDSYMAADLEIIASLNDEVLSYAYGDGREKSCEYTKQAVSHLLMGLKIDSYMAADLEIIASLNDEVGGVTVTIPTMGMEQADPEFVFGQTVRLKGEQAERFVRFRDTERDNSAISRMEQQKLYISGFLIQSGTILPYHEWNSRSCISAAFSRQ